MIAYVTKAKVLKKYNLESLECVFTGGTKISPKILNEFKDNLPNTQVVVLYGKIN